MAVDPTIEAAGVFVLAGENYDDIVKVTPILGVALDFLTARYAAL
jgi:hypothetical protein